MGREPTRSEWSLAVGMNQTLFELRIKEGQCAKDKLVNSNLRLVVSIVKNYQGRGMTLPDLIQVCHESFECIHLDRAICFRLNGHVLFFSSYGTGSVE